jgi:hypothetical protein
MLSRIWGSHSGGYKEFSSIKRSVVRWKSTEVSGEQDASIFRVEEYAKQETIMKQTASSSETSGYLQRSRHRYVPEDKKV